MFNQACPGMHVVAIDKVGLPSVLAATAQWIHFRMKRLMLFGREHAKNVPLVGDRFFRF